MKAKYLGLDLSSPVVVSSSPYTATVSNIAQCVRNGAGAVVLGLALNVVALVVIRRIMRVEL